MLIFAASLPESRARSEIAFHLLRTFFEGGGFTAQMGENFTREMERAGEQNRIGFGACER